MSAWPWSEAAPFCIGVALVAAGVIALVVAVFKSWHGANYIPRRRMNEDRLTVALPFARRDFKPTRSSR